jgi:hypothetical protein
MVKRLEEYTEKMANYEKMWMTELLLPVKMVTE